MAEKQLHIVIPRWRFFVVVLMLAALPIIVGTKIAQLQILSSEERGRDFLQNQGDARTVRTEVIPAYRGVITDRNGAPLAVSTPVATLIANPKRLLEHATEVDVTRLSKALGVSRQQFNSRLNRYRNKSFMYLQRQLPAVEAERILNLEIPGIFIRQEYKRFYPAGEVTAQLIGFTDINDEGQEGIELAYDTWLEGEPGMKKVIKDRAGRVIKDISLVRSAKPGEPLQLSIDLRVQYAAYRALKKAVKNHHAKSGSVVVLDVETGEILAMANQPSFNPNDRSRLQPGSIRNRAMTDMMEPGSTVKPFTILAALESGLFKPHSRVNTSPGYLRVSYKTFVDPINYGELDMAGILTKSSQVGTTKVALALNPDSVRELYERVGFGEDVGSGFPAETPGNLPGYRKWDPVTQATFAFGYGLSTSSVQLARAYAVLANDGVRRDISLLKIDQIPEGEQVVDPGLAETIRQMLSTATGEKGTGKRAMIEGYSVGGKTGTLHKVKEGGGYDESRYMSVFAGLSPVDNPRLVTVVVIDEPRDGDYFGGLVAAPVFSEVTGSALRLMQVPPDQLQVNRNLAAAPVLRASPRLNGREES